MKPILAAALLSTVLLTSQACGGDSTASTPAGPAGVYTATAFTTTFGEATVDQLAEGVSLTITLHPSGATSGSLLVPAAGGIPLDLAGTWAQQGSVVTFSQTRETFLRFLPFQVGTDQLQGDGTIGPTTFHVVLSR